MSITAAILSVGEEILHGRIVDTNGATIAAWLSDHGFSCRQMRVVGDSQQELVAAIAEARRTARFVIMTGGLGPTADDRTRHAIAEATGRELREHGGAWRQVAAYYRKIGRDGLPDSNRRQALLPKGAKPVRNDRGTAPGIVLQDAGDVLLAMPGVPHEMRAMLERAADRLPQWFPDLKPPHKAEIALAGIGESRIQDLLGDLLDGERPVMGITAHEAGNLLITALGSRTAVRTRMAAVRKRVRPYIIPDPDIAASLIQQLGVAGMTITAVESCTCGHIMARLGAVSGASVAIHHGQVTYHNDAKIAHAGVDPALLREHGAVSQEVVEAMALGARQHSNADVAIASSGIAGPTGGTRDKPVGTVWLAVADESGISSECIHLRGSRVRIQSRAASQALVLAWRHCFASRS